MRKEYDLSKGERGKFYGKVDIENPIIESEDETLDEIFEGELTVLELNLARIKNLKARIAELDIPVQEKITERIANASEVLDEIALSK
jgi:hypothetical protein